VLWYFIVHKTNTAIATNPQSANPDPSAGRPPYYTKPTYDMIKSGTLSGTDLAKFNEVATSSIMPYREPMDDEWGSMCGTWKWTFGYDISNNTPAGLPGQDQILMWCKGMNLNPVHLQGYIFLFKSDIVMFAKSGVPASKTWDRSIISAGAFLAK
jgi:hypothetical protein